MTPQFQKAFSFWMLQDQNTNMILNHPFDIELGDDVQHATNTPITCVGTNPSNIIHPNHPKAFYPLPPHLKPVKVQVSNNNQLELVKGHCFFHTSDSYFGHPNYWAILFGLSHLSDKLNLGIEFIEDSNSVKINLYDLKTVEPIMWVSLPRTLIISDEFEEPFVSKQIASDQTNAELFFNNCDYWKQNVVQVSKSGKFSVFQEIESKLLFTAGSYFTETNPWYFVDKATGEISGKIQATDLIHFCYHPQFLQKSKDPSITNPIDKFIIVPASE